MEETEMGKVSSLLAKGSGIIAFGILAGSAFNYLTRIVIARFLGSSAYGLISLGFAFASFMLTVSLLGFIDGVSRNTAYYHKRDDQAGVKGVLLSSLKLSLSLSVLIAAAIYILAPTIATTVFGNASLSPILQIFAISVPVYVLLSIISANFRGLKHSKYKVYTYDLLLPILRLILVSIFIFFGFKVVEVVWGYLFAVVFAAAAASYLLLTRVFPQAVGQLQSKPVAKKLLSFSWPLMISHVLMTVNRYIGIILLGIMKASELVGIFNAALPTSYLILSVYVAIDFLCLPLMSEFYSVGKRDMLEKLYKLATRWVMTAALPLLCLLLFFPTSILTNFFGPEYAAGAGSLSLLAVGYFLLAFAGPSTNLLTAIGETKIRLAFSSLIAALSIGLNLLLIPDYGVLGAGLALSLALSLGSILVLIYVYSYHRWSPLSTLLLRAILAALLASPLLFILPADSILTFFLSSFLFFAVYGLLLLAVRAYNQTDLETIDQFLGDLGIDSEWINSCLSVLEKRVSN